MDDVADFDKIIQYNVQNIYCQVFINFINFFKMIITGNGKKKNTRSRNVIRGTLLQ